MEMGQKKCSSPSQIEFLQNINRLSAWQGSRTLIHTPLKGLRAEENSTQNINKTVYINVSHTLFQTLHRHIRYILYTCANAMLYGQKITENTQHACCTNGL